MQRLLLLIIGLVMVLVACSPETNSELPLSISSEPIPSLSPISEKYQSSKDIQGTTLSNQVRSPGDLTLESRISDHGDSTGMATYDRKIIYTASMTIEAVSYTHLRAHET